MGWRAQGLGGALIAGDTLGSRETHWIGSPRQLSCAGHTGLEATLGWLALRHASCAGRIVAGPANPVPEIRYVRRKIVAKPEFSSEGT